MSKYSLNELEAINDDINRLIVSSTSEDSKLDRSLIFSLRLNMKKINEAMEIAEEDLKDPIEDYTEFEKERIELLQKHGGKMQRTAQGVQIENAKEVFESEDFQEELSELTDKYEEAIEQQNEIFQENNKKRAEKIAEVDWKGVPLSKFPEKISGSELPLSFIEFVYDDTEKEESKES